MGAFLFLFVVLMFQSFRLTEYIIIHGAKSETILHILTYLAISFLPVILPMSVLFSVLITYGRLSADSEIVAFKSLGLNIFHLSLPALFLGFLVTLISFQTAYYIAPWGNRKMEVLLHQIGQSKPESVIKGGVFSEGFFDMVVYANDVDSKSGRLFKVFIYDERNPKSPMTIIADEGQILQESNYQAQSAFIRLFDGDIHRTQDEVYTKINFKTFDISLYDPIKQTEKGKTPLSYNLTELRKALDDYNKAKLTKPNPKNKKKKPEHIDENFVKKLEIEYFRRSALAFTCIVFSIVGVGLGTTTNRRSGKSGGFVLSIAVVVSFWIIYATMESLAKSQHVPVILAMWTGNLIFLVFGAFKMYQAKN